MIVSILSSGSKGNSTLIETNNKSFLIDIGLPLSNLEKRLQKKMPKLDALIITHTHIDHIKGIKSLLKNQKPIIYSIKNDLEEKTDNYENIYYTNEIKIDDIIIKTFHLSHDVPCIGIYINDTKTELLYITDTGYIKESILKEYKNKDIYIIESNYDNQMLNEGSYPFYLKQRIRSDKGHLSNEDTNRYLKKLIGDKTKYVCLAHLSEENNNPEIVEKTAKETIKEIKKDTNIVICSQEELRQVKV